MPWLLYAIAGSTRAHVVSPSQRVSIDDAVSARLLEVSLRAYPNETGGLLLGWREQQSVVIVDLAEVPQRPPGHHDYCLREEDANTVLSTYQRHAERDEIGYVGTWHSHPTMRPPSRVDNKTFRRVAADSANALAFIVIAIGRTHSETHLTWISAGGSETAVRVTEQELGQWAGSDG